MKVRHNQHSHKIYDYFNQVFILAFAKVNSFKEASRVTERVLLEFAQSQKTIKELSVYEKTLTCTKHVSVDEAELDIKDGRLHDFLQMNEDTRLILALTYVHQLDPEQVGATLNLLVPVVKETIEDVQWKEKFTNTLMNLCDIETRQMVMANVERQLVRKANIKRSLKYGSAAMALLLFLALGSYVIQKPVKEERVEALPPIHEVIYERLSQEGYPQIKVGLTQEEQEIIIQVVGSRSYYRDSREKVKSVAREMLDERGYERYDIFVEPMAVERQISN